MKRVHIYLPDQQILRLKGVSEALGLPVAEIVRRAIDDYLDGRSTLRPGSVMLKLLDDGRDND